MLIIIIIIEFYPTKNAKEDSARNRTQIASSQTTYAAITPQRQFICLGTLMFQS